MRWVAKANMAKMPINYHVLHLQAIEFVKKLMLDVETSLLSFYRFRIRNHLTCKRIAGEAGSVPAEQSESAFADAKAVLDDYEPEDIYYLDETGLLYRLQFSIPFSTGVVACSKNKKHEAPSFLCAMQLALERAV